MTQEEWFEYSRTLSPAIRQEQERSRKYMAEWWAWVNAGMPRDEFSDTEE